MSEIKTDNGYEAAFEKCLKYFNGDELAANVFLSKYAIKDENGNYEELTPDDMHRRLAHEFARIEKKFGGEHQLSENEIFELFQHFKYIIPGGSVMSGLGNNNVHGSLSNCFVIGQPNDSYGSIMMYRDYQVEVMKRRGGAGVDISKLRPSESKVNNAALKSTGPVSFMEVNSEITKEVAQGGRRGALMISINGNHPDVEDFIVKKQDLTKCTGANISVQFTDDFMNAVLNNKDFILRWPVDKTVSDLNINELPINEKVWLDDGRCVKRVHANDIWNQFVHCSWNTAEPGIMYLDKHINLSPDGVYPEYKGITTNPCVAGDTIITTDKGKMTIKELVERFNSGEEFKVVSMDTTTNQISFEKVTNALLTRKNANIIELELEDGNKVKLTPDHKVYTENRGWVEASNLQNSDILLKISD